MTWIKNNLFFWRQTRLVPVRVTIADASRKKSRVIYWEREKFTHRRH